jgi:uncharacterized protein
MAHPQFRLFRGKTGKHYFNLTAKNGQVIFTSQGYASKAGALNGVKAVKGAAKRNTLYERKTAANGKYYFVLTSPNGQTIGKSEMYSSGSGRANGIRSVGANAGKARVSDET